jgi:hypothetical protein
VQALGVEALAATVQALASNPPAPRQPGHAQPVRIRRRQALIHTCHSYRSDGPLLQQLKAR